MLIPAVFGLVWLVLPFWRAPVLQLLVAGLAFAGLAVVLQAAGAGVPANFAKLGAMTAFAWVFLNYFEDASWVVLVARDHPLGRRRTPVWRGPTQRIVTQPRARLHAALVLVPGSRARTAPRSSGCRT